MSRSREYNSNTGKAQKRRRIGEFNPRILKYKQSLSREELRDFRNRMFNVHGILV